MQIGIFMNTTKRAEIWAEICFIQQMLEQITVLFHKRIKIRSTYANTLCSMYYALIQIRVYVWGESRRFEYKGKGRRQESRRVNLHPEAPPTTLWPGCMQRIENGEKENLEVEKGEGGTGILAPVADKMATRIDSQRRLLSGGFSYEAFCGGVIGVCWVLPGICAQILYFNRQPHLSVFSSSLTFLFQNYFFFGKSTKTKRGNFSPKNRESIKIRNDQRNVQPV